MMFYETKKQLCDECFDTFGYIKPNVVLEAFEAAASQHAQILGCGFEAMTKMGYLWVVVRTRYEISEQPKAKGEIKVKTWPLKPKSVGFRREYLICDNDDKILIRGTSDWFVINISDRCLAKAEGIYPENEEFSEKLAIDGRLKKVHPYTGETKESIIIPDFCDIDMNGHVNNTKYASYISNALENDNLQIASFQIDYHKEVMQGEKLTLLTAVCDGTVYAEGKNADGDTMFLCKIGLR